ADAFLQEGDLKKEFRALWQLSAVRSSRVPKLVFQRLLSTQAGARRLDANLALAALGLKERTLDALRGLASSGACDELWSIRSCATLALAAGDVDPLADRTLAQMQQTTDLSALLRLGNALAALGKEAHADQAARGADRILAQMQQTTD